MDVSGIDEGFFVGFPDAVHDRRLSGIGRRSMIDPLPAQVDDSHGSISSRSASAIRLNSAVAAAGHRGFGAAAMTLSTSRTACYVIRLSSPSASVGKRTAMTSTIRDCLPPDRNPRKPKVVLPAGIDRHPRPRVRAALPALSRPRLQSAALDLGRPQAPARDARRRSGGVHPALDLRHRQFGHPRRHGGAQRRNGEPGALRGGHQPGHHRRRIGRARQVRRARRAAQHRQQGRHADRDR